MEIYDYVVVGAGSAGCVMARRLSDDPNVSVLLLEAGGASDGFWNRTPAGVARFHKSERYNWNYVTEPVPALGDRKLYFPAGKALGGSSASIQVQEKTNDSGTHLRTAIVSRVSD